jgi:hypothetical protein
MNAYVISPNALNDGRIRHFIDRSLNEQVVFMGWPPDKPLGKLFDELSKGDLVIIAQGANWRKTTFAAGIIDDKQTQYDEGDRVYLRRLLPCVDLLKVQVPFDTDCSFGKSRNPGAIYKLKKDNAADKRVIDVVLGILQKELEMQKIIHLQELLTSNMQLVLTGAPGTGKTHLARQLAATVLGCSVDALTEKSPDNPFKDQFRFVQFHPAYDYTDFVEGLKPVKDGAASQITFELRDGIFKEFCEKAKHREKEGVRFVFVIDEINRADLSRVFGELFYALEPGYRGEKGSVLTQYASLRKDDNKTFYVPKNVLIIGTMNDIDRSVESIDFALRRRFAWCEIEADEARFDEVMQGILTDKPDILNRAKERYKKLNACIATADGLGSAYMIGPAYFRKLANYATTPEPDIWTTFWNRHLDTLIREYLRGRPDAKTLAAMFKCAYDLQSTQPSQTSPAS